MFRICRTVNLRCQSYCSSASEPQQVPPKTDSIKPSTTAQQVSIPANSRYVYPEFLPDPDLKFRHPIREKLERQDMISRR